MVQKALLAERQRQAHQHLYTFQDSSAQGASVDHCPGLCQWFGVCKMHAGPPVWGGKEDCSAAFWRRATETGRLCDWEQWLLGRNAHQSHQTLLKNLAPTFWISLPFAGCPAKYILLRHPTVIECSGPTATRSIPTKRRGHEKCMHLLAIFPYFLVPSHDLIIMFPHFWRPSTILAMVLPHHVVGQILLNLFRYSHILFVKFTYSCFVYTFISSILVGKMRGKGHIRVISHEFPPPGNLHLYSISVYLHISTYIYTLYIYIYIYIYIFPIFCCFPDLRRYLQARWRSSGPPSRTSAGRRPLGGQRATWPWPPRRRLVEVAAQCWPPARRVATTNWGCRYSML